ncbi:MAG: hypothetical protein NXY59_04950 [Aigarchaeota archaeon]|nr:hypothetical protein [Candidatus Pelearchaeum maunauluense]
MSGKVAIVGVGQVGYRQRIDEMDFREMDFEAASRAFAETSLNPRRDVDTFIHCQQDFWEGYSITSEYSPDQLGAALRTICTVSGDGIQGLVNAYMQIATGVFDVAVVAAHGKPSEVKSLAEVYELALDPLYHRQLGLSVPALAALEAKRYLEERGLGREALARVVSENKRNALRNPRAPYGADISLEEALARPETYSPLSELDFAQPSDGAIVFILANARKARRITDTPIYITGVGWCSETLMVENRNPASFDYMRLAAAKALKMAKITRPARQLDFAEVEDRISFKQLQASEALGIGGRRKRSFETDIPVNVSGGSLGMGDLLEASGASRVYEAVMQLRGQAGAAQLEDAETCAVLSCSPPITASCTVLILST